MIAFLGSKKTRNGLKTIFQIIGEEETTGVHKEFLRVVGFSEKEFEKNLKERKEEIVKLKIKPEDVILGKRFSLSKERPVCSGVKLNMAVLTAEILQGKTIPAKKPVEV